MCRCMGGPGTGRAPGEWNGNPLHCSYLENSMDREAWQATVHGVTDWVTNISFLIGVPKYTNISSVQFNRSVVSDSLRPHESQYARPPCPSQTPGVYSNSCPSSRWCHPAISSSVVPFSSCPQSLPAPGSFPTSQFFAWGGPDLSIFQLLPGVESKQSLMLCNKTDSTMDLVLC